MKNGIIRRTMTKLRVQGAAVLQVTHPQRHVHAISFNGLRPFDASI